MGVVAVTLGGHYAIIAVGVQAEYQERKSRIHALAVSCVQADIYDSAVCR